MIGLLLAAVAWLGSQQLGPGIPALRISYMAPRNPAKAPAGIEGLSDTTPGKATVVLFQGGFDFGATDRLQAALDAAPRATTVLFDSPGGRMGAAAGVAGLIRQRHLATAVTQNCNSACTVAFVAGQPRLASRSARFAFHLGTLPIMKSFVAAAAVMVEQPWFVRGGVSLGFANRALHAPNLEPYKPALDELVAAGYVQRIVPALKGDGATDGLAPLAGLLAAVAALEPATRQALGWEHADRMAGGMEAADSADMVEAWAGLVVNRWLGRTSDAAANAYVGALVDAMEAMTSGEASACMRWQVGLKTWQGLHAMPQPQRERLRQAQEAVLRDAKQAPQAVPDGDALSQADQVVRTAVKQAFGDRALIVAATAEHAFDDPARSCAAATAYLKGLRDQPGAGRLVRWALAAG